MDFSSFNERSTSKLGFAARMGDLKTLKVLLRKRSCDVNYNDNRGWTALHEAAAHDRVEAAKLIIGHKSCRPCVRSHDGKTALVVALVALSSIEMIELLLSIDGLVNCGTTEDVTPLHVVAKQGRVEAAVALLRAGAALNKPDFDGDTPLHEAAHAGQPQLVSLLLHAGCNPEPLNDQHFSPLHLACLTNCADCVREIIKFGAELDCLTSNGETPLSLAASKPSLNIVQFLLECGASPNLSMSDGQIPLRYALNNDNSDIFKLLFEHTDPLAIDFDIVEEASRPQYFNLQVFDAILKSNLGPEFFNNTHSFKPYSLLKLQEIRHRFSVLPPALAPFLAVAEYLYKHNREGFESLLLLYLMRGVPVNAYDENDIPPLQFFQYCPNTNCGKEVIRILVEHGANVDDKSDKSYVYPDAVLACLESRPLVLDNLFALLEYSLTVDIGDLTKIENLTLKELLPVDFSSGQMGNCPDSLMHFSLKAIRRQLRKSGKITNTKQYLLELYRLPLPHSLCNYIRLQR